ncbi:protein SPA1-RELATED 4-like isoform X1 [Musa acuminata AAA Group]|uniref:protein SPA1-RELATED 4-like isoform X1 n=1 Tax=Musa acuminata AAA Group TaxID=214697 RepID=UPI0031D6D722
MEGNETTDTEISKEAAILKTENDRSPHEPVTGSAVETYSLLASHDSDWPEHLSLLRSPEVVNESVAGRNFNYNVGTQAGSQPLCASLHSLNNPAISVEELTLKNYKNPYLSLDGSSSLSLGGSSSSGEKPLVQTSSWPNFTRIAGRPKQTAPKDYQLLGRKDAGGSALPPYGSQTLLPLLQSQPKTSRVDEHVAGVGNHRVSSNLSARSPHEIRPKSLSSSGFQQFFIRSSSNGKAVACKHQKGHDVLDSAISALTIEKSKVDKRISSNLSHAPGEEADRMHLLGCGELVSHHGDITLREWLKPKRQRISKAQRMHIFKQILGLVDACHTKGLALQHLRPSYFLVLPVDQIKYIGSFVPREQVEQAPNIHHEQHPLKKKRHREPDEAVNEFLKLKHQKLADDGSVTYLCKIGCIGNDQGEENEVDTSKAGNSRCDFRKLTEGKPFKAYGTSHPPSSDAIRQHPMCESVMLEEGWYVSPEELNGQVASCSTNIYSLGVLFFELFCCSETWEVHCTAMSDLRHRILPPSFLSESPKESGFCLWLLHPEPYSRPKSRDIILSDLVSEGRNLSAIDHISASTEEEDAETDLLLHFLLSLKEHKEKQAADLVAGLECIRMDFEEVKRRHLARSELVLSGKVPSSKFGEISEFHSLEKPVTHVETMTRLSMSNLLDERLNKNINQLENAYFTMRSKIEIPKDDSVTRSDTDLLKMRDRSFQVQNADAEMEVDHLGIFFEGLCKFARYSKFEVCGGLKNDDILNCANVICSLSFDGDEDYFAAAGVSKKIKIFEFSSLLNDTVDIHYPLIEMSSRSRLSCVCWNSYIKNYLASTDYEGVVQLWDASTGQGFTQFRGHQKRAWSVNFSQVDPAKLASGSDDFSVKLWSTNEKNCIDTIRNTANVCCVQFSPYSSHLLSFGTADYRIHCYDLRNTRIPWCTLGGHGKAVSYVKFLDAETLVSASTDNTLKIWDLKRTSGSGSSCNSCSLTLQGHTNEKNFVGLSVYNGYIACGSETNEVYAYYRTFPMPMTCHKFGSIDPITAQETSNDGGQFVSSVCWRGKSNMVVAANSTGSIKVMQLV